MLEYKTEMVGLTVAVDLAWWASICQLRSQRYYATFEGAAMVVRDAEAQRLHLTTDQQWTAMGEAVRIAKKIGHQTGFEVPPPAEPPFGLKCKGLGPKLDDLDALERKLTGNYH